MILTVILHECVHCAAQCKFAVLNTVCTPSDNRAEVLAAPAVIFQRIIAKRHIYRAIFPVRFQYAEYYYAATEVLCRDMLSEIQESGEYRKLKRSEDFYFFFGRWRGEARKLKWTEDI